MRPFSVAASENHCLLHMRDMTASWHTCLLSTQNVVTALLLRSLCDGWLHVSANDFPLKLSIYQRSWSYPDCSVSPCNGSNRSGYHPVVRIQSTALEDRIHDRPRAPCCLIDFLEHVMSEEVPRIDYGSVFTQLHRHIDCRTGWRARAKRVLPTMIEAL